jgi:hypothetical protein
MTALSILVQMHAAIREESSIPAQLLALVMSEAAFAVFVSGAIPNIAAELKCPCCN